MKIKVGIIGHFGGGQNFYDGQTVKTQNLMSLFDNHPNISILKADTYYATKNKLKLLLDTLLCMVICKHIFLMVSVNGMRVYLPLLYYLNKITRKHIYHYIIGSELLEMVSQDSKLLKYLNAFDANWFEYESGTKYLQMKGVINVSTVPNFKLITPVSKVEEYVSKNGIYSFCTFSRVIKEKGITDAINAISKINIACGKKIAQLDIYGSVDSKYASEFEQLIETKSDVVSYKGTVDSVRSVEILKDYYALLFPTYWAGEGFPGTIIDAFASGIPVIASDWNANSEILQNMKNGIIYPNKGINSLEDAVIWSLEHPQMMNFMRYESRKEFDKYMPEAVRNMIFTEMYKHGNTLI